MKSILISDHAKWCALMMNGKKKVEVRKGTALYKAIQKLIDEYGYAEFYVCCTKGNYDIVRESSPYSNVPHYTCVKINKKLSKDLPEYEYSSRGKVAFKFRCYKVEEIETSHDRFDEEIWYSTGSMEEEDILEHSCLNSDELDNYLYGEKGTAIHISDLEIFDKPKELSEFKSYKKNIVNTKINGMVFETELDNSIIKAPQSYMFIEAGE